MVAIRALFIDNKLFDIYWKSLWIFYRFFSFFRLFFLVFCFLFSDLSIAYHIYISTYSTKSIYDFPKHKFFFNSLLQLLCLFIRIKLSSRIMNRWFFFHFTFFTEESTIPNHSCSANMNFLQDRISQLMSWDEINRKRSFFHSMNDICKIIQISSTFNILFPFSLHYLWNK